jgi:hypothetical protein
VADVTARYVNPDGLFVMTVEADDKGDSRISQGNQYAVLTRGGVAWLLLADLSGVYAVRQEDWLAVTLAKVRGAMPHPPDFHDTQQYEIVAGGAERVGGRSGTLWSLQEHGKPPSTVFQFVISDDPDLAPVGRAFAAQFFASASGMGSMIGSVPAFAAKANEIFAKGTVIRMGHMLRLESVSKDPIPAADFALPAVILSREQYAARLEGRSH